MKDFTCIRNVYFSPQGQLLVIVEYCSGGNLLHYLRKKNHNTADSLTVAQQIDMGRQIASGMDYLSSKKVLFDYT